MMTFDDILKEKQAYYGNTQAAYDFAQETYKRLKTQDLSIEDMSFINRQIKNIEKECKELFAELGELILQKQSVGIGIEHLNLEWFYDRYAAMQSQIKELTKQS